MENRSLTDYLKNYQKPESVERDTLRPWYNIYGDCIEYQTEQVAIVADRIDGYLTIYRSAENDNPIGFQLKDVKALMKKYQSPEFHVRCEVEGMKIVSVIYLLLTALEAEFPLSIKKRSGYFQAIKNLTDSKDTVSLEGV